LCSYGCVVKFFWGVVEVDLYAIFGGYPDVVGEGVFCFVVGCFSYFWLVSSVIDDDAEYAEDHDESEDYGEYEFLLFHRYLG